MPSTSNVCTLVALPFEGSLHSFLPNDGQFQFDHNNSFWWGRTNILCLFVKRLGSSSEGTLVPWVSPWFHYMTTWVKRSPSLPHFSILRSPGIMHRSAHVITLCTSVSEGDHFPLLLALELWTHFYWLWTTSSPLSKLKPVFVLQGHKQNRLLCYEGLSALKLYRGDNLDLLYIAPRTPFRIDFLRKSCSLARTLSVCSSLLFTVSNLMLNS